MIKGFFIIVFLLVLLYIVSSIIKKNLFAYYKDRTGSNVRMCRRCGCIQKQVLIYKGTKTMWLTVQNGKKDSCICDNFLN